MHRPLLQIGFSHVDQFFTASGALRFGFMVGGMQCLAGDLQSKPVEKGRSQFSEMKWLEKENARLKKTVAELKLDKQILNESLNHLKPRVPLTGSSPR